MHQYKGIWIAVLVLVGCAGQAPLAPKAVELNQAGVEALEQGDLLLAEARLALALEYHPRFVDALVNLGLVELQRGNFDLARRYLDKAMTINRHVAQPHHGFGVLSEREGNFAAAAKHYREALKVDPGFMPSRANLARIYFMAGEIDHAREQFLRLTQVAPKAVAAWVGLMESLCRLGRLDQVDQVLDQALEQLPNAPELHLYVARRALTSSDFAQAEALLTQLAKEGGPLGRDAWSWLGVAKLMQGQVPQAIECAERALAHDRSHALATYVLSMALSERGDRDALAWLRRAAQLAPGDSVIRSEAAKWDSSRKRR